MAAQRIVTLLPSATEIVCGLGLRSRLVGVTHECDFPSSVNELPRVTRSNIGADLSSAEIDAQVKESLLEQRALYSLDEPLMRELAPDLIITQALCEVCAVAANEVEALAARLSPPPPILNLEPMSLSEVFETIGRVAEATGAVGAGEDYLQQLKNRVETIRKKVKVAPQPRPRVAVLEWLDPIFNAGHWTPELVELAGGEDCLGIKHQASFEIPFRKLEEADPDIIIISLCGFDEARAREDLPLLTAHQGYDALRAVQQKRVHFIDGNAYLSRSGPRLVDSLELLYELFQ